MSTAQNEAETSKFHTIIAGAGKYLPPKIVTSEEIENLVGYKKKLDLPDVSIEKITGVKERRYVADSQVSSDLAVFASKIALERAGVKPEELDTIIFASATQDISEPATVNIVQDKLKAVNAEGIDVKNACNSFINALDVIDAFVKLGRCKIGLVCSGEVLSKLINYELNNLHDLNLGFAGLTLGDGGGAVVVKASEEKNKGIIASSFISDGSSWDLATLMAGGTLYPRDLSQSYFVSHSAQIDELARKFVPQACKRIFEKTGWKPEDIDLVVPHQVSRNLIIDIGAMFGVKEDRVMITIDKYGNTAAASIPIALTEAFETHRIKQGSKVLLVGGASGFSAGVIAIIM